MFVDFSARLPDELRTDFKRVLEMAATSIPIDALFADISSNPESVAGSEMADDTLAHIVETTFATLLSSGITSEDAMQMMRVTDPFREKWDAVSEQLQRILDIPDDE